MIEKTSVFDEYSFHAQLLKKNDVNGIHLNTLNAGVSKNLITIDFSMKHLYC